MTIEVLLNSAAEEGAVGEHISLSSLGMLIRDVWKGNIKPRISRINDTEKITDYFNMRKRSTSGLHKSCTVISELTYPTIEDIKLLCTSRPSWIIDSSLVDKKLIRLMRPLSPERRKVIAIDEYRLTLEIKISMVATPLITLSTCGREVLFCKIRGHDTTELQKYLYDQLTRQFVFLNIHRHA